MHGVSEINGFAGFLKAVFGKVFGHRKFFAVFWSLGV
jgi:hypothetical protein